MRKNSDVEEEALNTSHETVINRSIRTNPVDQMMDDMVNKGFGCIKITDDSQNNGLVSFLDQSLKLDTAEKASEVVKAIQATQSMKALELRGNTLGIEAGKEIAKALETHPELERCLWSDILTGRLKHDIPPILKALGRGMIKAGAKIKELDLSDNAFGPIGADALKEFLESPSAFSLEVLKLNNNGFGVGGKQIAKSLTECLRKSIAVGGESRLRLKTFIAGRNRLENPGAHALAATFKSLETIEWFDVRQNGIYVGGIHAIVDALKYNRNLRHLCLEDNTVLPEGAKALTEAFNSWPKLEVLNLSDCLIRDAGCNYVVDHLNPQLHRHLKHVFLCGNELTPPVAKLLIQKWAKFDGFTPKPVLHIHTNSFGDEYFEVAQLAPENVNVGVKTDDLGSMDGDHEEYNCKSSDSDDADVDNDLKCFTIKFKTDEDVQKWMRKIESNEQLECVKLIYLAKRRLKCNIQLMFDLLRESLCDSGCNLKLLDLSNIKVKQNCTMSLIDLLKSRPLQNVEQLIMDNCDLNGEQVLEILTSVSKHKLNQVSLVGNGVMSQDVAPIAQYWKSLKSAINIDLAKNCIGDQFDLLEKLMVGTGISLGRYEEDTLASVVFDDLETHGTPSPQIHPSPPLPSLNSSISKIQLITGTDGDLYVSTLTSKLEEVDLSRYSIGIEAGKKIAKALETHPELKRCLWSDLLTGRLKHEIPPILEALGRGMIKAGAKIKELDLSDNAFGPIGASSLKEFLESPSAFSLEVLKLNNNGLGVGGKQIAKSLTECLRKSIAVGGESRLRLKTFIAGRNRLKSPGAHALAATFKSLETVEWLDVRQNGIHEDGIRAIVAALKYNRNLRHLCLEDNTVLPKGAKALARTLESWPKLEVLNLSDCLIRDAGCNYVVDHLNPQLHRHLKHVFLCGNELTPPVAKLLIQKWAKFDGFTPKPVLHIHTNSFGNKYYEVAQLAPENVKVGEKDDDLGSLDGDEEEYKSKSSDSDDADVDETTVDANAGAVFPIPN